MAIRHGPFLVGLNKVIYYLTPVTHRVTHNKKGPNGKPLSPCFKWSG